MDEEKIEELFGGGRLTYDELKIKAGEYGIELGDVKAIREDMGERLHEARVKGALERELDKSGARSRELISKVIDWGRVSSDEDGVYGLAEQFEELKRESPYLFEEKEKKGAVFTSGISHSSAEADPERMEDNEYYRIFKKL